MMNDEQFYKRKMLMSIDVSPIVSQQHYCPDQPAGSSEVQDVADA